MKKVVCIALLSLVWTSGMTQSDESDIFVGTWVLQKIEQKNESGDWLLSELLGPDPLGILIYDAHGNMAAQLARRDRSISDPEDAPSELVNGYVGYFGRYDVDSTAGTVTHHRSTHVNAELAHLSVVRYFHFEGDTVTLTVAPERNIRLLWKRED